MNGAQRAAFKEMVRMGREMATAMHNMKQWPEIAKRHRDEMADMQERWDAAHARYFELEAEARKAKSSARKSTLKGGA